VPGAVQGVSAAFSCGAANFCASWTAPSSNGGSPITGYRIQATGDINAPIDVIVTSTSWISANYIHGNCAGNGTLTISAINAIGQGPSETRSGSWGYCD
jgi:titin